MDRRAAVSIIWDCFAYIFRGMQEYIPNQHQPFEVPVLFLLINILLAVLIGGYAAGELHGTGLNSWCAVEEGPIGGFANVSGMR